MNENNLLSISHKIAAMNQIANQLESAFDRDQVMLDRIDTNSTGVADNKGQRCRN